MTRWLIVNADDLGFSRGINRGIAECHEHGIVTSSSLMVDRPGAAEAAAYARAHPELGVGLHLELRGPRPLRREPSREQIETEVRRQLDRFRRLVAREPTHLDSHRHVHRRDPARSVVAALARELGVAARDVDPLVTHCGEFYGQTYGRIYSTRSNPDAVSADALIGLLETLPEGVTELCCHPGYADDLAPPFRREPYRAERPLEVRALCDPRVREAVEQLEVQLCTFADLAPLRVRSS
ncbi:MAG TPA: ChbG/HpnK family deacetylase [Gaiellaceae bacterium]|nr:ChbG/HpnK family deacetylase [Gaiellaceae bacterium]